MAWVSTNLGAHKPGSGQGPFSRTKSRKNLGSGIHEKRAWFKVGPVGVTVVGVLRCHTLARSASEGWTYHRLRFGLVSADCYPGLNPAEKRRVSTASDHRNSLLISFAGFRPSCSCDS